MTAVLWGHGLSAQPKSPRFSPTHGPANSTQGSATAGGRAPTEGPGSTLPAQGGGEMALPGPWVRAADRLVSEIRAALSESDRRQADGCTELPRCH